MVGMGSVRLLPLGGHVDCGDGEDAGRGARRRARSFGV